MPTTQPPKAQRHWSSQSAPRPSPLSQEEARRQLGFGLIGPSTRSR